jgi:hypothetical protein
MALILQFPRPSRTTEPEDGIVSMLEELLERARAGDVQSIVLVTAGADGHPECCMAMDRGHAAAIIGALRVAEKQVIDALDVTDNSSIE